MPTAARVPWAIVPARTSIGADITFMRGKLVLALLADLETRLFGLAAFERRSGGWIAQQRQIARVYFAIGLTTSILAGTMTLMIVLAIERRPDPPASSVAARSQAQPAVATPVDAAQQNGPVHVGPEPSSKSL